MIKSRILSEQADILASYLPGGRLFRKASVADSNFRNLLLGLAGEMTAVDDAIQRYYDQYKPDATTEYLAEWERALGIPDDCFSGTGPVADRRRDILAKLAALGVQTAKDFVDLAALFGVTATIRGGRASGVFDMYAFPIMFYDSPKAARFTMIVTLSGPIGSVFTSTFPLQFGSDIMGVIECLFTHLKPANVNIIFERVP